MEHFKKWFDNLLSRTSRVWERTISVRGECRRHTGPSVWFAAVTIELSPNYQFEVAHKLDAQAEKLAHERGWYDYIVFGVLDILLIHSETPIRNFKLTIQQIEFDEIESNQLAFRLAARSAAVKAIEIHFQNSTTG